MQVAESSAPTPAALEKWQLRLRDLRSTAAVLRLRANGDMSTYYTEFKIPKASGGFRTIHSPNDAVHLYTRDVVYFFRDVLKVLEHNNAFAYVRGRGTKDALVRHRNTNARWFLKLDLKNFFPNSTKEFIMSRLRQIYPINLLDMEALGVVIEACMLNGGLPQGAPSSPYLSNIIMIPTDYELNKTLYQFNKSMYTVTRYADDILISSPYSFKYTDILTEVERILSVTPYQLNKEKTRYSSSAGRNWNLGLMYTEQGNITTGHVRKKRVKNGLYYFFRDNSNTVTWSLTDAQSLIGDVAYVLQIEPNSLDHHLTKLTHEYGISWSELKKKVLNPLN
jgi:hypothetical protein